MAEGQVSDIIETPEGFFIVKAYKVQPGSGFPPRLVLAASLSS